MPRAIFIHGFNVWDGGAATIDRLTPFFALAGFEVIHDQADYGWTELLRLRCRNADTVARLLKIIQPGDVLVAHSNAALISHQVVKAGAPVAAVVCIQAALRRDTVWRQRLPVLCLHNRKDRVVRYGARWWGRFATVVNPWRNRHGWGAAGYFGFSAGQPNVTNWNTNTGPHPATGHSGIFETDQILHWGRKINQWAKDTLDSAQPCGEQQNQGQPQ